MKVRCTQCGAGLRVLETDFYLRCPYCEACVLVRSTGDLPSVVEPAAQPAQVERLFPVGGVESIALRYFPWVDAGSGPAPVFSQPWEELAAYTPPSGNRRLLDGDSIPPESLIPVSDEYRGDQSKVVYHPFYMVMLRSQGYSTGVLVDGVSCRLLGSSPLSRSDGGSRNCTAAALRALAVGILPASLVFLATRSGDTGIFGGVLFATIAAALTVVIVRSLRREDQ